MDRHLFLTPQPSPALKSARAIVRAIQAARRAGRAPEAGVLCPGLHAQPQDQALTFLWSSAEREALLGVPVEVDPEVEGWAIRIVQTIGSD